MGSPRPAGKVLRAKVSHWPEVVVGLVKPRDCARARTARRLSDSSVVRSDERIIDRIGPSWRKESCVDENAVSPLEFASFLAMLNSPQTTSNHSSQATQFRSLSFRGSLPLAVSFRNPQYTAYVQASRISYLPLLVPRIMEQLGLEGIAGEEVWFDFEGRTLGSLVALHYALGCGLIR